MEYLVGILLALAVALGATGFGLDRDRAFYPTVLIVIASYYGLFAVMGGSLPTLVYELIPMALFTVCGLVGFKWGAGFVVIGLVAHAVFDVVHPHLIDNAGVPVWWPGFCLTYDATMGLYLVMVLWWTKVRSHLS